MLIKDFYFFKEETEVKDSEAIPNSKGNILVVNLEQHVQDLLMDYCYKK